jgi:hypothetical protein
VPFTRKNRERQGFDALEALAVISAGKQREENGMPGFADMTANSLTIILLHARSNIE